jgi:hypothetical protein
MNYLSKKVAALRSRFVDCTENGNSLRSRFVDCTKSINSLRSRFADCTKSGDLLWSRFVNCTKSVNSLRSRFVDCTKSVNLVRSRFVDCTAAGFILLFQIKDSSQETKRFLTTLCFVRNDNNSINKRGDEAGALRAPASSPLPDHAPLSFRAISEESHNHTTSMFCITKFFSTNKLNY